MPNGNGIFQYVFWTWHIFKKMDIFFSMYCYFQVGSFTLIYDPEYKNYTVNYKVLYGNHICFRHHYMPQLLVQCMADSRHIKYLFNKWPPIMKIFKERSWKVFVDAKLYRALDATNLINTEKDQFKTKNHFKTSMMQYS